MLLFAILIYHCTGPAYDKMAIQQPLALLSIEDSLRKNGLSKNLEISIAIAHRQIGLDKMKLREYNTALEHFERSMRSFVGDWLNTRLAKKKSYGTPLSCSIKHRS